MRTRKRRCFVHIGTHKTGTTSFQHWSSTHQGRLAELGYLYPLAGRPAMAPHGHHNIAWEISNDYRFQAARGGVDDVLAEISDSARHVILSSEDFEISAHRAEMFDGFVRRLRGCGLDVVLVVYFRNQIDYAKSLYLALLGWGLDRPFSDFIDEIVETGQLRWRNWVYPFDYDAFARRLQGIEGVEVLARSYDTLADGATVADFLSIIGIDNGDLRLDEQLQLNRSRSMSDAAKLFYRNCSGRQVTAAERDALAELVPREATHADMSVAAKLRLIGKFEESNKRLCQRHGLAGFDRMQAERTGMEAQAQARLDDLFCNELIGIVQGRLGCQGEPTSST